MLLSGRPVYDPNPLRPNPNPKKPVSGSCRVRGLGRTLTPLILTLPRLSGGTYPAQISHNNFSYEKNTNTNTFYIVLRKEVGLGGIGISTVPSSISRTFFIEGRRDGSSRTHQSPTITILSNCLWSTSSPVTSLLNS